MGIGKIQQLFNAVARKNSFFGEGGNLKYIAKAAIRIGQILILNGIDPRRCSYEVNPIKKVVFLKYGLGTELAALRCMSEEPAALNMSLLGHALTQVGVKLDAHVASLVGMPVKHHPTELAGKVKQLVRNGWPKMRQFALGEIAKRQASRGLGALQTRKFPPRVRV